MSLSNEEKIMNNLQSIEEWALQGLSIKEMSDMLEIGYSTFRRIKQQNRALRALLENCAHQRETVLKEQVKNVEESVYKRATGYNYKEQVPVKVKKEVLNENGVKLTVEEVEVVTVEKHSPADIGAAKFFLMNKAKEAWKNDPHKVEHDKQMLKMKKDEAKRSNDFADRMQSMME